MPQRTGRRQLRPLYRRRSHSLTERRVLEALAIVDEVGSGNDALSQFRDEYTAARAKAGGLFWRDVACARAFIDLARVLFRVRRISWAHYVFLAGSTVEGVHDDRWLAGKYESYLRPVTTKLDAVKEGDPAAVRLNAQYNQRLDHKLALVWQELGADDVGTIWQNSRAEYDDLRERGRRYVHHRGSSDQALRDLVDEGYANALAAADGGHYRAAITLLGASLEGLLLLRCLRARVKASRVARDLPRRFRSRAGDDMMKWSFEMLIEVCRQAGWLPLLLTETLAYSSDECAHSLREMRNWIHPAREAAARPWQGVFKPDYDVAHAFYTLVATAIRRPRAKRRGAQDQV